MNKRERIRKIKSIQRYLQENATTAFEMKNEYEFDWYADGSQMFLCVLQDQPIKITPRVKSL